MAYRLGLLTVHDPELSTLELAGDGFAAAGELVTLVVASTVQARLGFTDDEVRQAQKIAETYRQEVAKAYATGEWLAPHRHPGLQRARAEAEARIEALLGPRRTQRLKRVSWRTRKADALLDAEVADALGLSDEQRQALLAAMDANEARKSEIFNEIRPLRLQSQGALQQMGVKSEDAGSERLLAILTAQQRQEYGKLQQPAGDR